MSSQENWRRARLKQRRCDRPSRIDQAPTMTSLVGLFSALIDANKSKTRLSTLTTIGFYHAFYAPSHHHHRDVKGRNQKRAPPKHLVANGIHFARDYSFGHRKKHAPNSPATENTLYSIYASEKLHLGHLGRGASNFCQLPEALSEMGHGILTVLCSPGPSKHVLDKAKRYRLSLQRSHLNLNRSRFRIGTIANKPFSFFFSFFLKARAI